MKVNKNYQNLHTSYLFGEIYRRTDEYKAKHPDARILNMGVGDVVLPLNKVVIEAMHRTVDELSDAKTFQGYVNELGIPSLRKAVAEHYKKFGADVDYDEVFISSGAADDIGSTLALFSKDNTVAVIEPAYPEYIDANIMDGRKIVHIPSSDENDFLPLPPKDLKADIIYICSPGNPTGASYTRDGLKKWVDFANENEAVIIFDAAYEAYIEDSDIPHSIYEIDGSKTCAIEICSLSKTAGFTGMRCGYTVVPTGIVSEGISLNKMWERNRLTRTNGVSFLIQKAAEAVFTDEGQKQIMENIEKYKKNARAVTQALTKAGISFYGGKNSPYIWIHCPDGMDSWEMFDHMINKYQLVGTPGGGFGECGKYYFRLSTFCDYETACEAAKRLTEIE